MIRYLYVVGSDLADADLESGGKVRTGVATPRDPAGPWEMRAEVGPVLDVGAPGA